jgi:hypothetical protein
MSPPLPTLLCFPIRGRTEPIRVLLAEADQKYTESRVGAEWPQVKQEGMTSGKLPFGQLPGLIMTGGGGVGGA